MPIESGILVHNPYVAFARGNSGMVLALAVAELEWTFLDPSIEDLEPQSCHRRGQLAC